MVYIRSVCRIKCRTPFTRPCAVLLDGKKCNIDIRGDGGQVVAPRSLHRSGYVYEAVGSWSIESIKGLPVYDPSWLESTKPTKTVNPARYLTGQVPDAVKWYLDHGRTLLEGERNTKLFTTACSLQAIGKLEDNALHLLLPIAVASGLDRKEAIASIASAYKEERTIPTKSKLVVDDDCVGLSTQDLLADTGVAGTQWVWEGIIAKGCMTLVCGSPKAGKSTFLDTLLWHMDNDQGQTQFIENLKPGRILYLAEESKPVLQIRLQVDDLTGIENVTWILKQKQYDLTAFMEYLHRLEDQYLSTNSYDMVILDTLGNWLIIENECDNSKVSVLLNSIKDFFLARHPELALVLVHHFGKPRKDDARNEAERIRGASAFVQVPDMLVTLSRFNNKDLSDRRRVLHFVGRFHPRAEQVVVELKRGMPLL